MAYLLDTDICIYLIKKNPHLRSKFEQISANQIYISTISVAEMEYGVAKSTFSERNAQSLKEFIDRVIVVNFDSMAAYHYGIIRCLLERKGSPIGSNDLLIAAIAKSLDFTLVTNNEREFKRVEGLKIENWTKETG